MKKLVLSLGMWFVLLSSATAESQLTQKWFLNTTANIYLGAGNVDADAQPEILMGSDVSSGDSLYLVDGITGQIDWSIGFETISLGKRSGDQALSSPLAPQLLDVDADGKMEVLFHTYVSPVSTLRCYDADVSVGIQDDNEGMLPKTIELGQNYPNPFNPSTTIQYSVSEKSKVTLVIYNALGQKVRTLVDKEQSAGEYSITWDGKDNLGNQLATGAYFYALKTETEVESKKMLLLK